ncbi:hypothetical protein AAHA92_13518 [Salvia divinorum]|uniref:F-box domain-containing protein n=1 Tax=Salvia divinorum TaxID=28513 RepID=A0ABD1H9S3_SALDI
MEDQEIGRLSYEISPMAAIPIWTAADNIPQEIIQDIQSLLDSRNAAKTAAISKSWRLAWSTRPVLDFHDLRHRRHQFRAFAVKTMRRYGTDKLSLNSFSLRMDVLDEHHLAAWLVLKAIKLGATNISLRIRRSDIGPRLFALPDEVLDSGTLASLDLHDCIIRFPVRNNVVLKWSNLKSIIFSSVITTSRDLLINFISKCTSLERVKLQNTRSYRYHGYERASYDMIQHHKLKSLELVGYDIKENMHRHDLWPKFPFLKELVIRDVDSEYFWPGLRICSPSLELISLHIYKNNIPNGRFDVPNIRKFEVVGTHLPNLVEFKTSSGRKWESDIQVTCQHFTQQWFSSLSKLLRQLSSSQIYLSVRMAFHHVDYRIYAGDGLPKPVVEMLKVWGGDHPQLDVHAFVNALLRRCDPKCITEFNQVHEIDVEKRDDALLQVMDQ